MLQLRFSRTRSEGFSFLSGVRGGGTVFATISAPVRERASVREHPRLRLLGRCHADWLLVASRWGVWWRCVVGIGGEGVAWAALG